MQHFFSNTTKIKEVIMAFNNLGTPVTLGPGGQIIAFMSYGGDHGAQILAPNIIQNGAPEGDGESEIDVISQGKLIGVDVNGDTSPGTVTYTAVFENIGNQHFVGFGDNNLKSTPVYFNLNGGGLS
jgi:hypothetical protein